MLQESMPKTYRLPVRVFRETKTTLKVSLFDIAKEKTHKLQPKQFHLAAKALLRFSLPTYQ